MYMMLYDQGGSVNGAAPKWMIYKNKPFQNGWFGAGHPEPRRPVALSVPGGLGAAPRDGIIPDAPWCWHILLAFTPAK